MWIGLNYAEKRTIIIHFSVANFVFLKKSELAVLT